MDEEPRIFVFSAKDHARLTKYLGTVLSHFEKTSTRHEVRLADAAYTLQVGRDEENERLALVADSFETLCEKLAEYLKGNARSNKVFQGSMATSAAKQFLPTGASGLEYVTSLIKHQDFEQIAAFWVQGGSIDWQLLYGDVSPRRVPLPTPPFENSAFWVPRKDELNKAGSQALNAQAALHAFIDANTSTFEKQAYQKVFTGREFYLLDHVIQGRKMLPASAFLEMAHAAANLAHPKAVRGFSNLVWKNPLIVDENPVTSEINLFPSQDHADFGICNRQNSSESVEYCSGIVLYAASSDLTESPVQLDLNHIAATLQASIDPDAFYGELEQNGFHYGDNFRSLKSIRFNDFSVLAEIAVPDACPLNRTEIGLHPVELDAAFQAVKPLLDGAGNGATTAYVPYAIDSLIIRQTPTVVNYVYGERILSTGARDNPIFNIKLLDRDGHIVADIKEFAVMPFTPQTVHSKRDETLLLREQWSAYQPALRENAATEPGQTLVIHQDSDFSISGKNYVTALANHSYRKLSHGRYDLPLGDQAAYSKLLDDLSNEGVMPENIVYLLGDNHETHNFSQLIASLAYLLQAYSQKQHTGTLGIAVLYPGGESVGAVMSDSVNGFLKTMHRENSRWHGCTIGYDRNIASEQLLSLAEQTLRSSSSETPQIRVVDGQQATAREFVEIKAEELSLLPEFSPELRNKGVYLITGGGGGLGLLFAEYLATTHSAKLILLGRSKLDEVKQAIVKRLNDHGSEVLYLRADVADKASMERALEKARARFGEINGIIHSAGINRDRFIISKTQQEFNEVLSPKVQGTLVLDQVTATENLDFFVMFSSVAAAIGNAGQADYATANAFQDAFAAYRNRLVDQRLRHGKTISINWPLWREGGMQLGEPMIQHLQDSLGLTVLETDEGLKVFEQILKLPYSEVIVARGNKQRLRQLFADKTLQQGTAAARIQSASYNPDKLRKSVTDYIKALIAKEIQWPAAKISDVEPFGHYGIDSVMTLNLTSKLAKQFGDLPKTLFFEYKTVGELAEYFVKVHAETALQLVADSKEQNIEKPVATDGDASSSTGARVTQNTQTNSTRRRFIDADRHQSFEDRIAIVGISGRYPQANNVEEFYQNLLAGKDCITEIPKHRWNSEIYFHKDRNQVGKCNSKWGGFLDDIDQFDPLFFNISPTDATTIDPQERLFLESVWNTLEDAGTTKASLAQHKVGVFVGVMWDHYQFLGIDSVPNVGKKYPGSSYASIANRVSYWFDFDGPSLAVDTMCSSSLTAIHYACESIKRGECSVAIAGGVNLAVHPVKYLQLAGSQFLSTDGKCRSFGEGGDGYVPGEGVGSVLLKPLRLAQQDGDHIYAIVRGSVINHGGKSNGFHVPNPVAQGELIQSALKKYSISPNEISFVEAHGTGTPIGDPIEIEGLKLGFNGVDKSKASCAIGSVKSNIGHLEAASGMAALTKVILQMKHGKLFPSLHAETVNPNIDFNESIFKVQKDLADWPRTENKPYLAGISSFGAGGSNAFLIIESVKSASRNTLVSNYPYQVIPLSAKTRSALQENARSLAHFIRRNSRDGGHDFNDVSLENIAFTLQRYRESMEERVAIVSNSLDDLVDKLSRFYNDDEDQGQIYSGSLDCAARDDASSIGTSIAYDEQHVLQSLCEIAKQWVNGQAVDFAKSLPDLAATKISLPTYSFQRKPFWYSGKNVSTAGTKKQIAAPLIDNVELAKSTSSGLTFKVLLTPSHPLLQSHLFRKQPLLPGMAYLEMVSEAIDAISPVSSLTFSNVSWHIPIFVVDSNIEVFIAINQRNQGYGYEIWTERENKKVIHGMGTVQHANETDQLAAQRVDFAGLISHSRNTVGQDEFYHRFAQYGLEYNNDFRCITESYQTETEALALFSIDESSDGEAGYLFHPAILDSALQTFVLFQEDSSGSLKLPFAAESISLIKTPANQGMTLTCQTADGSNRSTIADARGNPCVIFSNINFRALQSESDAKIRSKATSANPIKSTVKTKKDSKIAVEGLVKDIFSQCLNLQPSDLKSTATFDQYGLESVMAVEIKKLLEATFGDLPVTVLFEYQTVDDLVGYLLANHSTACDRLLQSDNEIRLDAAPLQESIDTDSRPDYTLNAVQAYVKNVFVRQLSIDRDALKPNLSFDQYGLESVAAMEITRALEDIFGSLPATTLFEHSSIGKLSEFLIAEFPEQCGQLSIEAAAPPPPSMISDRHQTIPTSSIEPEYSADELRRKVEALSEYEVDSLLAGLLNTEREPIMEHEANEA
ncbi:MAG: SDR family NAD(P)-dependent oxidoreductase [Gammaproteobacteria bacterium]